MTQIEQVKSEIERILNLFPKPHGEVLPIDQNAYNLLSDLKIFIDSLMPSEDSEEFDGLEDSIIEYLGHIPENDPEHSETLYTYEQMQEIARHFVNWQKEQSTKLLKTIYSDCDNLKKDLDRVTTGNLSHRIGNIKFSITGIQVIIKQAMEDEQ